MWKKTTSLFTKKKGSSSSKPSSTTSSRGGYDTTKEERHSPPWWHEGNKEHVHEVHRTSRENGGAAHSTSTIDPFIRATTIHSAVFFI
jgi:hypothetical protein